MKSLPDIASGYGSADRPLRRYIALFEALERVLGDRSGARREGQELHLSLVRTWGFHLVCVFGLRSAHILYVGRNCKIPITFGERDEQMATDVDRFAQVQGAAFKEVGDLLMFQVQMPSSRLVGALRRRHVWAVEDIGWVADSIDLLRRVSGRARRREQIGRAHV